MRVDFEGQVSIKIELASPWLTQRLKIISGYPECALVLDNVYAHTWCGKYGPYFEPVFCHYTSPRPVRLPDCEIRFQHMPENTLSNIGKLATSAKIVQVDNEPYLVASIAHAHDLMNGVIHFGSLYDPTEVKYLKDLFPGLSVLGSIEPGYFASNVDHIAREVSQRERGGRPSKNTLAISNGDLNTILDWHKTNKPDLQIVPAPARGKLPLSDPWSSEDDEFREWLIDQCLSRNPLNSICPKLHKILEAQRCDQRSAHQLWSTRTHAIMSTLKLDTSKLPHSLRRALRIAMLVHDCGKIKSRSVWVPGCHAAVGSKLWRDLVDLDLTNNEISIIDFVVEYHDVLGRMDKWIKEPSRKGALHPLEVCDVILQNPLDKVLVIDIMKAVCNADIGSVSSLRWLCSLTEHLANLIILVSEKYYESKGNESGPVFLH